MTISTLTLSQRPVANHRSNSPVPKAASDEESEDDSQNIRRRALDIIESAQRAERYADTEEVEDGKVTSSKLKVKADYGFPVTGKFTHTQGEDGQEMFSRRKRLVKETIALDRKSGSTNYSAKILGIPVSDRIGYLLAGEG